MRRQLLAIAAFLTCIVGCSTSSPDMVVIFTSDVEFFRVYWDGRPVGGGAVRTRVGKHELTAVADGHKPAHGIVEVTRDMSVEIEFDPLEAMIDEEFDDLDALSPPEPYLSVSHDVRTETVVGESYLVVDPPPGALAGPELTFLSLANSTPWSDHSASAHLDISYDVFGAGIMYFQLLDGTRQSDGGHSFYHITFEIEDGTLETQLASVIEPAGGGDAITVPHPESATRPADVFTDAENSIDLYMTEERFLAIVNGTIVAHYEISDAIRLDSNNFDYRSFAFGLQQPASELPMWIDSLSIYR